MFRLTFIDVLFWVIGLGFLFLISPYVMEFKSFLYRPF